MGLNDCYVVVRSSILMSSLLQSVMSAFNIVFHEKFHKSLYFGVEKHVSAFVSRRIFKSKAKKLIF